MDGDLAIAAERLGADVDRVSVPAVLGSGFGLVGREELEVGACPG